MREIKTHLVAEDGPDKAVVVKVADDPGPGGASHLYTIDGISFANNPSFPFKGAVTKKKDDKGEPMPLWILFQNGGIPDAGNNGLTHEVLLAIVIDRLESFQAGPYPAPENQVALNHCKFALEALKERTRKRVARGVEGKLTA